MSKLWQTVDARNTIVEEFTAGEDVLLDQRLISWDCISSIAHALTLERAGVLTKAECQALCSALSLFARPNHGPQLQLAVADEDCHTAIENFLVSKLGDIGKKIHSGRSRNDQVISALKLYSRNEVFRIATATHTLATEFLAFARKYPIAFPGYSHTRKAMPSTIALWASCYLEALVHDLELLLAVAELQDASGLGSASGYGTALPLDRHYTAELLGFSKLERNVLYVQNARGKNEFELLSVLASLMLDLNRFSADVILFSLPELGYLIVPEEFTTGSSIMPQKKNPDVLELVRAKAKVVASNASQVLQLTFDLPAGYNRDLQLTKKPLIESLDLVRSSVNVLTPLVANLIVVEERCKKGLTAEVFATDRVYELVARGVPFREAYQLVKKDTHAELDDSFKRFLAGKTSVGAPGNLGLDEYAKTLTELEVRLRDRRERCNNAIEKLLAHASARKRHEQVA